MGRLLLVLADASLPSAPGGGLLTDYWRDVFTWVSLGIGVVSLAVSAIGLLYSVLSWRAASKAQTAAEAAKKAAEETRAESQRRWQAFAAGRLQDFVTRAISHLHRHEWGKAVLLLNEVGHEIGHFAVQDETWKQSAQDLLEMAATCTEYEAKCRKTGPLNKWTPLLTEILSRLPAYQRPI